MKKIIAVALASAFAAPAFAATSNVDIYGRLNIGFSFLTGEADGEYYSVADSLKAGEDVFKNASQAGQQLTTFGSRIGFKGSEDLGGGLKGIWQIESGINFEEKSGTLAGRNSFVGLAGGFGTVLLGNHDTPLKLVGRKVDLFGDTFGDSRNILGGGSDTRANNVVAYATPNMSGFSALVAYSTDLNASADATEVDEGSAYNFNVEYSNGPIYAGFAYGDGDYHDTNNVGAQWRVAGGFSFGDFRVVGQYDVLNDVELAYGPSDTLKDDYTGWMLGGSYNMGAMTFKGAYMSGEFDGADIDQYSLGVDYAMSKRTTVYALWTQADGDFSINGVSITNPSLGIGASASDRPFADSGDDIGAITVGVAHNF